MTLLVRPGFQFDTDASTYIEAVEAADTQALETATRYAINNFVIGCKQDGIWSAIKASCILAGARTLNGALVPLVGTAPTNFAFVAGDYNRKTGLKGDRTTKYLDSNRNNSADPQNSKHLATVITEATAGNSDGLIGAGLFADSGSSYLFQGSQVGIKINNAASVAVATGVAWSTGFAGASRAATAFLSWRNGGSTNTFVADSVAPLNNSTWVFARGGATPASLTNARLAFYSIGESLDLARLDSRVTDLITAFGAAIP